jgi:4-aminobutyrate aminotransferase-like enzyme
VLKIRPPLPFGRAHADQLVTALAEVVEAVAAAC